MPKFLQKYFWEYEISSLGLEVHKKFIIERILEKGNWRAVKWILKSYGKDTILSVVKSSDNISDKTRNFWVQIAPALA